MKSVEALIMDATAARHRVLEFAGSFTHAQGLFKPDGEWSIAENLEHLVLAEQGCINRVWTASEALRAGRPVWTGEAVHRGRSIEEIVRMTWAPRQEAFDVARPRRFGPLSYWIAALRCNQPLLEALPRVLRDLDPEEVVTPHGASGPMDACQWLAFVRFHLDMHREQAESVTRAPGFPGR
jgi:hypothetical protein